MEFNTDDLQSLSNTNLIILATIGYAISIVFYISIKNKFAGKLLNSEVYFFGNVSRLTHIFSYMILGFVFPNRFILFMIFGLIWEVIEYIFATMYKDKYWGEGNDNFLDLIANAVGFLLGYIIRNSESIHFQ
tara:strand:- start:204 stop:599 length:396 start_codon:yes stop_codon:yes gene_type:complete